MLSIENILKSSPKQLPGFESHVKMAPYRAKVPDFTQLEKSSRIAAVSIVLFKKQNELYFPLIKRPSYNGHHANQISFPGGKLEAIDKSLFDTAIRETEEEIGVNRTSINLIQELSKIYIPPSNFIVSPYLTYVEKEINFVPDQIEVESILEVKLEDLLDNKNAKTKRLKHSNNIIIDTPYFELNNEMVWGATAMILNEFKDLLLNES